MSYRVEILNEAQVDIDKHTRSGRKDIVKKIGDFISELETHPRTGTGKPERLRYMDGELWSRRIDNRHRLVYEIAEERLTVIAISAFGHYMDK